MVLLFTLTYNVVCGYVFPFLFGTHPGMQLLGHVVTLFIEELPDFFQSSSTILHTLMTLVKHVVISREVHDQVSLLFTLILPPFKNWQLQDFPGGLVVRTRHCLGPGLTSGHATQTKKQKKTVKIKC